MTAGLKSRAAAPANNGNHTGLKRDRAEDEQHRLNKTPGKLFCLTERSPVFMDSFVLFMDSIRTKGQAFCFIYFTGVYRERLLVRVQ